MDKKEFSVTLLVIGLSVLFAIAGFALFLSRGKSKFWTSKKIKIGAMLLTLTAAAQSCSPFVTCYDMPAENYVYLDLQSDTININNSEIVSGTIDYRTSEQFSFLLQNDTIDTLQQSENILPLDGAFDEDSEKFTILIDTSLQTGNYFLKFFNLNKDEIDSLSYSVSEYSLKIINNK